MTAELRGNEYKDSVEFNPHLKRMKFRLVKDQTQATVIQGRTDVLEEVTRKIVQK
jgi:hypothetical protein